MLYIKKGFPPAQMIREVIQIKSTPEWKKIKEGDTKAIRAKFDELSKEPIRESLLKEQGEICAYCMRRIKNSGKTTTIEHLIPLSRDKEKALDYRNMLAVCDGGTNSTLPGRKILCCDAKKEDEEALTLSPFNEYQMDKIAYDTQGFIKTNPEDIDMERDLNEVLGLNGLWKNERFIADTATNLVKGRQNAYERYRRYVRKLNKKGKCTSARIKKKIDEIEQEEQKREYAGVLLYFLKKKYHSLIKRGL